MTETATPDTKTILENALKMLENPEFERVYNYILFNKALIEKVISEKDSLNLDFEQSLILDSIECKFNTFQKTF